ncbi:MAG: hypothetical protein HQ521_03720 [Bacteroidetes bacterium]|nr:hypothetical protein [Bacteroidota bacterium]
MVINNRINQTFGSAGSFSGYILLVVGLVTITSWVGIILVLIGLFFALSFTGTSIDKPNNRFRQYTQLFGLFKVGDWEELSVYKNLTVMKNDSGFRVFSQGNRTVESKQNNYLIYMLKEDIRNNIPIKKCKTFNIAISELEKLSKELKMPVVEEV